MQIPFPSICPDRTAEVEDAVERSESQRFQQSLSLDVTRQHSIQGALGLFDLLLQSLLHALVGRLLQHVLHVPDGRPVARGVVEHSDGLVAGRHQEAAINVKPEVGDLLAVDGRQLLLQLAAGGVVHGHVTSVADGHHPAVRGERHPTALGRSAGDGLQEVGVLLLLVLHVSVPQLPCAIFGHAHHSNE